MLALAGYGLAMGWLWVGYGLVDGLVYGLVYGIAMGWLSPDRVKSFGAIFASCVNTQRLSCRRWPGCGRSKVNCR
jgi:hypothetical protein